MATYHTLNVAEKKLEFSFQARLNLTESGVFPFQFPRLTPIFTAEAFTNFSSINIPL